MRKEIPGIVDLKISHRHPSRSASVRFAAGFAGAAGVLTTGLGLIGCGGETGGQVAEPTRFSEVLPTSEAPDTPTLIPAVYITPEPTVTPEPVLTSENILKRAEGLIGIVNTSLEHIPEDEETRTIKLQIVYAVQNIKDAETDPLVSVTSPITIYGDIGLVLGQIACNFQDDQKIAEAWLAVRDFVQDYAYVSESAGKLEQGAREGYMKYYFTIPESCQNLRMVLPD